MEKGPVDQMYPPPAGEGMPQPQSQPPPYQYNAQHAPPPGYNQQPGFNQPPIQVQPVGIQVVHVGSLGSRASRMTCPHCGADIQTRVRHTPGVLTHVAALILCLVFCPCVCIPYCVEDCMDAEHECPNCDRHIGVHKPL